MIERFTVPDELTCYYDRPCEPANVHLEARIPGRPDQIAVRASVRAVLASEPRLLTRRLRAGYWQRSCFWEFPVAAWADPLQVVTYTDQAGLDRLRDDFLSHSPPLEVAPPLLFLLASGPGGDWLILNAHHACFDGLSCLRLLRQVAAEYRTRTAGTGGGPARRMPAGTPSAGTASAGTASAGTASAGTASAGTASAGTPRADAKNQAGSRLQPVPSWRSRAGIIARVAPGQRDGAALPGYGVHLLTWDGLAIAQTLRAAAASVNDLLIVALMITIRDWNESRGVSRDLIRITMPVGDRDQADAAGRWANLSRLTTVTARVPAGTQPARLIRQVARQTRHAKQRVGPQVDLASRALVAVPVPVAVKRMLLRAALRVAGPLFCDTSLVSNIGVVDQLAFGKDRAAEVWFSTSAHMPRGLSLGAVTAGGRLRLAFRYRRALFSSADAAEFAARYVKVLDQFNGQEAAQR
jgi:NRPS condensation-like uncharacterized protein